MAAINNLSAWLSHGNQPENAEDAFDLERSLQGRGFGKYRSQEKGSGMRLVTGPGEGAFLFHRADAEKHVSALRDAYASEPGASFEGDAAFARAMAKDD